MDVFTDELVGNYVFTVDVESDTVINEPKFTYAIEIEILACFVEGLNFHE